MKCIIINVNYVHSVKWENQQHQPSQDTRHHLLLLSPLLVSIHPSGNQCSDVYLQRLDLLVLEFHVNETIHFFVTHIFHLTYTSVIYLYYYVY